MQRRSDPVRRETDALGATLAKEPRNIDAAARLAQLHIERARRQSDPRGLGQAQAVLAPWWGERDPPVRILLLRATIRQSNHEFPTALDDLARAVSREPGNAQAWLTLATVQQVSGDPASARQSCLHLAGRASPLVVGTCVANVEGATGNAERAYRTLDLLMNTSARESPAVVGWATTLQAELAARLAKPAEAQALFQRALALDPEDSYAIATYADFLIDSGRPREVLRLISPETPSDPLLLRYAIAARLAAAADRDAATAKLAARFGASRARGDRVHLREEARYTLEIGGDAKAALALARENWKVQKEPADARILLEAALAAGDREGAREVLEWRARTRLEDSRLATLAARLERK